MTSRPPPQCLMCRHWLSPLDRDDDNAQKPEPTQVCAAFPLAHGGIPADIWWNRADHRAPYAGDQGIQWEADDDVRGGGKMDFPEYAMNLPAS